jgi:ParB-like chromosome segregation protein Spo0J
MGRAAVKAVPKKAKVNGVRKPHGNSLTHIKDLIADPQNRRTHNPRNIGMIVDALQKVGASRSIVIDETGTILAGNGVVEAASEAGLTKVQIVDADGDTIVAVRRSGLSEDQKRHLAIADNRTAELATWNLE